MYIRKWFSVKNFMFRNNGQNDSTNMTEEYCDSLPQKRIFHGKAKVYFPNGKLKYAGNFNHGKYHGMGSLYDKEGKLVYTGNWENGLKSGKGCGFFSNDNDFWYAGEWLLHHPHGKGTLYIQKNLVYTGWFKEGQYHGYGVQYFHFCPCMKKKYENINVIQYRGNWVHGQRTGYGFLYKFSNFDPSNTFLEYKGYFLNNDFHGGGELFERQVGEKSHLFYKGQFDHGRFHGHGKIYRPTRSLLYDGNFANGKEHGFGTLYDENDNISYYGWFFMGNPAKKCSIHNHPIFYRIRLFLETRNYNILDDIENHTLQSYLLEIYKDSFVRNENPANEYRQNLLQRLSFLHGNMQKNESPEDSLQSTFDLFGNEIDVPVIGSDGNVYDKKSMDYLFQVNNDGHYINIPYIYKDNSSHPNFPIMHNGKRLSGYSIL